MGFGKFTLGLAGLALAAVAFASAPVGDGPVEFRFSKAPVNALGIQGLADLRGKPVLIDFWGTR